MDSSIGFDKAIGASSPQIQEIARALRSLIADVYPGLVEAPWPKLHVVGYGVGPKKLTEHFCYIGAYRDSANLGFNHGRALPDPEGLLEGTGKSFRHVKILTLDFLERPALRNLLVASVTERQDCLGGQ